MSETTHTDAPAPAAAPAAPGLTVEHLSVTRMEDGAPIVRDMSLRVQRGHILGVVGESGSGKTTLALALLGFAAPGLEMSAARIAFGERTLDITSVDAIYEARRNWISYIPQDPTASLNPALSIRTQLYERLNRKDPATQQAVAEVLRSVGLPSDDVFLKRRVGTLSGGQQQRVAIAMAAVTKPHVLVLDEPTTGLDVSTQASVLELVKKLCRETNMCGVFISHDLAVVHHVADQILVMYAGVDVERGPSQTVTDAPAHPYTEALLRCVPEATHLSELRGIPGRPPDVGHPEPGCPFAPRCEYATDDCRAALPPLQAAHGSGGVRCIRFGELQLTDAAARRAAVAQAPRAAGAAAEPVLQVTELNAWHGPFQVLHDVAMHVERGECVAIVGQSGSGKTTMSRCLTGLHENYQGTVRFDGENLAPHARKRSREARRRVQFIFQNPFGSLNPRQTIGASLAAPLALHRGIKGAAAIPRIEELLERVELPASSRLLYPGQMSGGQQQRVAIARSLAAEPDLIVCDEVTSALDVSVQAALLELLRGLRDTGVSLIFVTHDLGVVRNIADRVYVLNEGRVVEHGSTVDVIDAPRDPYTISLLADTLTVSG